MEEQAKALEKFFSGAFVISSGKQGVESMKKQSYKIYSLGCFAIVIAVWCGLTYSGYLKAMYLPTPGSVINAIITMIKEGTLWIDMGVSIKRVMVGWALAAVIALPVGIICARSVRIRSAVQPIMEFFRYLPVTALVPLTIIYCGIGEGQKYTIIFLGTFFQLVIMIEDTVAGVDRNLLNAGKTLGTTEAGLYYKILLPASMPGIMDAFRTTIGWSWTYLIVAEMISADSGLGYLILKAQRFVATDEVFAGLIMIGIIGLGTDILMRFLTRLIVPWYERLKD